MPYSPDNVGDLQMQIQSSLITAVEELKRKRSSKQNHKLFFWQKQLIV